MGWLYDSKSGSATPLEYFEKKYGYLPTQVILSKEVEFDAEDWGLEVVVGKVPAQPGHILLR